MADCLHCKYARIIPTYKAGGIKDGHIIICRITKKKKLDDSCCGRFRNNADFGKGAS